MASLALQNCLFVVVFAHLAGGFSVPSGPGSPPAAHAQPSSTNQLQEDVDALLGAGNDVTIRSRVGEIFALVDQLIEAGNKAEAMKYVAEGLKHNSWAMDYQMLYAEMLQADGQIDLAREKAALVSKYAETDELVNRSRRLRNQEALPGIPPIASTDANTIAISLVAVGDVDVSVVDQVTRALEEKLRIPVRFCDAGVRLPPFGRDPAKRFIFELRSRLNEEMTTDRQLMEALRANGITRGDLDDDETLLETYRMLAYATGGEEAVGQFNAATDQSKYAEKQWDADELRDRLASAVAPYVHDNIYFVGIANLDIYSDDANFVFGVTRRNTQLAIVSYRRFAADFYGDNPTRGRLVDRTLKQCLSSIGFMLGVPRCTSPTCARAYPNSLEEHDAKSLRLCNECGAGFEQALGRPIH